MRVDYAYREGTTEPFKIDLGEILPGTRTISGENIDLQTVTEITLYCRADRDPSVLKTFTLTGSTIAVEQDGDGYWRRLKISPVGTELKFLDRSYECYFEITDAASKISTWPEGESSNPYFTINMLEKYS